MHISLANCLALPPSMVLHSCKVSVCAFWCVRMSMKGALFTSATSQFFERFSEKLESFQQDRIASEDGDAQKDDSQNDIALTKAQRDHLVKVFGRWYKTLDASAGLSSAQASEIESDVTNATASSGQRRRKRTRGSFSFLRGECGEACVQLPHARLIPTEWQSQVARASAPSLASSAATVRPGLDGVDEAWKPSLLGTMVRTLATLSPLYEAFLLLFCVWFTGRCDECAAKAATSAEDPRDDQAAILAALGTFCSAWLAEMAARADGGESPSVTSGHCVAAADALLLSRTSASCAPQSATSSPSAVNRHGLTRAFVAGVAELFFVECERLCADDKTLAFGPGTLPLSQIEVLLGHIRLRVGEVMASPSALPPAQRRRLRVGVLAAECLYDPRRPIPEAEEDRHDDDDEDEWGGRWPSCSEEDSEGGEGGEDAGRETAVPHENALADTLLSEAWRQQVNMCRCDSLCSVLLTTYDVAVVEPLRANVKDGMDRIPRFATEQELVFERVAVANPERAARKGALHWFSVGRAQRHQDPADTS